MSLASTALTETETLGRSSLVAILVLVAHGLLLLWLGAQVEITPPLDQAPSVTGVLIAPEKPKSVEPPPQATVPKQNTSTPVKKAIEPQRAAPVITPTPAPTTAVAIPPISPAASAPPPTVAAASAPSNVEPANKPAPVFEQQTVIPPRQDASSLSNTAPAYPALSRRLGEEGRVLLDVHILADGSVGELKLKKSSGSSRLDEAAMKAVKNWKYIPARQGGQAIAFWYVQPVSFVLNNP